MNITEKVVIDPATQRNINLWLNGHYDDETKAIIRKMLLEDPKQAVDSFYTNLTFGTAGLRGIMGVGSNRMNAYTVRGTTQGLANYMLKQPKGESELAVFIGYDSRHHSREFAEETAKVLAANGIRVYLTKDIRPTPYVSFGCRYKHCMAAIMITASHNPAEYNGYKVYWSDGGQVVPPHDQGIIDEALKITDPTMVKTIKSISNPLITEVEKEEDSAYLKVISGLQNYPEVNKKSGDQLKIVYTSLHGTGITLAPKAFAEWGFKNLSFVEKQIIPDGNFPTVKFPNPEEHAALQMGIDTMLKANADILIANDPDADRVGVAVNHKGEALLLNGNQMAVICLEHICEARTKQNRWLERPGFIKSIVTTELFQAICDHYKRTCANVLTGFKYIAEKILDWEKNPNGNQFIFGAEESYGYLPGTYARDKDAISTSALICEAALQAKLKGQTLIEKLDDIYRKYGVYYENVLSLNFGETKEGKELMVVSMDRLRNSALTQINGVPVVSIEDYLISKKHNLKTGVSESITLPVSNILVYWLEDGTKVIIRPSGTEPKVKIYCGIVEKAFKTIPEGLKNATDRCNIILNELKALLLKKI